MEEDITLSNNFQALSDTEEENNAEEKPSEIVQTVERKREIIPPITLISDEYKDQFLGRNLKIYTDY